MDPGSTVLDVTLMHDCFSKQAEIPNPLPRHFAQDVEIAEGLFIGPFSRYKDEVRDMCEPPGLNWDPNISYPTNYAVWHIVKDPTPFFAFDTEQALRTLVQLSRLVRPTSLGFHHAARIVLGEDEHLTRVIPARLPGCAQRAWVADESENWLRNEDLDDLARLWKSFTPDELPKRIQRALWMHEYLHQMPFAVVRWPMAAAAIESLVHTDRYRSTKQFVDRALRLSEMIGFSTTTKMDLEEIYNRRSAVAHGQHIDALGEGDQCLYQQLENLLRSVVRAAIEDETIRDIFQSAAAVEKALPLS